MEIKICDRCGSPIEKNQVFRPNGNPYDVWVSTELEIWGTSRRKYELCFKCANEVKAFLQGRNVENVK